MGERVTATLSDQSTKGGRAMRSFPKLTFTALGRIRRHGILPLLGSAALRHSRIAAVDQKLLKTPSE